MPQCESEKAINACDSLSSNSGNEDLFIIVPPEPRSWKETKGYGVEGYDKKKRAKHVEDVEKRGLEEQLLATTASIRKKTLIDRDNFYFVTEVENPRSSSLYYALEALSATVQAYLDDTHLLVSAREQTLEKHLGRKLPLSVKEPLLGIREMTPEEQVSYRISEATALKQPVLLHVMPNEDETLAGRYLRQLARYLREHECSIAWTESSGMLVTAIEKDALNRVLNDANIIFKVHFLPRGYASKIKSPSRRVRLVGRASSISESSHPVQGLPTICVVDSGANSIPQLAPHLIERSAVDEFTSPDDGLGHNGHGTPIACLAALGEKNGPPRARIISYKIFSDEIQDAAFRGMIESIKKYASRSRIFVSSIDFEEEDALPAYAKLDKSIQESNVVFVSSAGNIPLEDVRAQNSNYPSYLEQYPVLHPSQNSHVVSVGAIAKKNNGHCIAKENQLSPFTRCGKTIRETLDVRKPDLVEHGGNLINGTLQSTGVGVSSFTKHGAATSDLAGTSFAAPLIAGRVAEIISKYGGQLRYSETYKAILFMSCREMRSDCAGFGLPDRFLQSDAQHATFVSEGIISLSDLTQKKIETRYSDTVSIAVPSGVKRIDMCLVHSDSYHWKTGPSLDTRLHVKATKSGRPSGPVSPNDPAVQDERTYAKFLTWDFKRKDMEGNWDFEIIPEATRAIPPLQRKRVTVRYGCVITITSTILKPPTLTYHVLKAMRKFQRVHIA
jgi:hypothetical protein